MGIVGAAPTFGDHAKNCHAPSCWGRRCHCCWLPRHAVLPILVSARGVDDDDDWTPAEVILYDRGGRRVEHARVVRHENTLSLRGGLEHVGLHTRVATRCLGSLLVVLLWILISTHQQ